MERKDKYNLIIESAIRGIDNTTERFQDVELEVIGLMVKATIMRFFENEELANDNCQILDMYSHNGMEANKQKKLKKIKKGNNYEK